MTIRYLVAVRGIRFLDQLGRELGVSEHTHSHAAGMGVCGNEVWGNGIMDSQGSAVPVLHLKSPRIRLVPYPVILVMVMSEVVTRHII